MDVYTARDTRRRRSMQMLYTKMNKMLYGGSLVPI